MRQADEHVDPWPGGAQWGVNSTFADAAFSGNALVKAAQAEPSFTLEILYALLLEDANERANSLEKDRGEMHEALFPNCSLSYRRNSHPQGVSPIFLLLAMTRPRETLRFALDLVAFVSDRWHERFVKFDINLVTLVIPASDSGRAWRSLPMLKRFNWKDLPHPVDKILGTIAQSWNRRLAAGEDLTDEFASVLSEGGSTPVLDLLIAIGLERPFLFVGPLFDLATCPHLCQRHPHLMRVLHTLVKDKPGTSITIDSTMKWWSDEARRREWDEEFQEVLSRWRSLALSENLDEDEWNRFFGVESPDPISIENCIRLLRDPRPLFNQGLLPEEIRTMLEERLSLEPDPAAPTPAGGNEEDPVADSIEAKRCAAAAILISVSLVSKDISPGVLALCREILLAHAQPPSAQPNGIYTHFNYGLLGRMNYEREEATAKGMTAYALPTLLVIFPDDPDVRLSFARTMFAREIIVTDMMWKSINLLRQWLDEDYVRSLHLVLRVAAVREGNRRLGGYFGSDRDSHEKATETAASTRLERLCEEFATRAISASIPDWNAIIAEECDPIRAIWAKAQHPGERRKSGGFDTYLMNHSEPNSLRRADGIIDPAFISWWQGCADYIHWCEINDETPRHERWSQEHFRSWAQSLAQISVLIGDGEIAKPLWLPMLNLAPGKIENVTEFLNYWWEEAINQSLSETSVAGFVEAFVRFLHIATPLAGASDFHSAEIWTAALGLQDEFRALVNRPADVRCPPALLAEFGPLLVATKRDTPIRGTAHYLSLGFSGIEDRNSLQWFADEVTSASYLIGQAETAKVLLQMLIAMGRRSQSDTNLPQFRQLLNALASHPWSDAVRFQQELGTPH